MTRKKGNEPELIEDKDLENASGGAVQKVRAAASSPKSQVNASAPTSPEVRPPSFIKITHD